MPKFQNVRIQRFKNIKDAPFDLRNINVLVGANNSGKSSIIQAIHFAIGAVQTLKLDQRLVGRGQVTSTVDPVKLIYVPSEDVHALGTGGRLWEHNERSVKIDFTLDTGEILSVSMRKGRNRNIQITVSDVELSTQLGNIERPFTIFTPGLAGIAKTEQYVSDGVLLRAIARGDANLVLRNTLLRLWITKNENQNWNNFINDLEELFPAQEVKVVFESHTDEYIIVTINTGSGYIPLELCGTGVLQTIQILSYVHYFSPNVLVLDEPDSHLHPNNQRILCSLLRNITQFRGIQIILCTHSRHVLDALHGFASFLWARNGSVDIALDGSDLAILLDLGALDVKERIKAGAPVCIMLTEDEKTSSLKTLLESSGFDMSKTVIIPYYGCTKIHNLRPLINTIRDINDNATIVIHMDRDYHSDQEIENWKVSIRALYAEPFVTQGVDIESHFISPDHLAKVNDILSVETARELIQRSLQDTQEESIRKFINGRCDIEKKAGTFGRIDIGQLANSARTEYNQNPTRYCHSKTVISKAREIYQNEHSQNLHSSIMSEYITSPDLAVIAQRVFDR